MPDDPSDAGQLAKHSVEAHSRHCERRVEGKADQSTQNIFFVWLGVHRNHRVEKNTKVHSVGFFKERTINRRSQRATSDVAEQDHTVQFQFVNRAMKLAKRSLGSVHRNGSKPFEAIRGFSYQV